MAEDRDVLTDVHACTCKMTAGSLSLETLPLKTSLKAEAASWKAQFAQNLHHQSAEDLRAFDVYIRCVCQVIWTCLLLTAPAHKQTPSWIACG
jgi:hypothetical protein